MTRVKRNDAKDRATTRNFLSLIALGSGLAVTPAAALELGDIAVESSLGQPLRASIAYALAPNEMLSTNCVSISAVQSTGGLPGIGGNNVSITDRAIVITGTAAVREPMLGARVTIDCPYTPHLSREYMLFVDPAPLAEARAVTPPVARPEAPPVQQRPAAAAPAKRAPLNNTPVGQSSEYQVQPGDTLSNIVRRIENRTMQLWPAVNAIFEANPDAFIDNDPNRLRAGSWLTIPSLDGTAPVLAAPAALAEEGPQSTALAPLEEAPQSTALTPLEEAPAVTDMTADLKPGDIVYDFDLAETGSSPDLADAAPEEPQTSAAQSDVPTAVISTGERSESTSLLAWLVGGGLAIIGGLILLGRRFRKGPVATPAAGAAAAGSKPTATFADYHIEDDSPTEENLALDADLGLGTGFDRGVDIDVEEADFGFAATTDLDIELPFEPEASICADTDIIPPAHMNIESILESEILPEDDDYDMSVIVDATKMPLPDEVTERDLQAVEVSSGDESSIANTYTISREVDYDILEQDYEDELTATQALNQEIERAAAELAHEAAEKTAEFEASYDPNDTNAVTVNMSHEDKTAEMPVANDDETTEMEIEGGTLDTKRLG